MKKLLFLTSTLVALGLTPAFAQMGGHGGPSFGGATAKLFGANQTFSATMEFQTAAPSGNGDLTMPGKFSFDTGKARFEMNMAEIKGSGMDAATMTQMKTMGMDSLVSISRPDLKLAYIIYPGLNSYLEAPLKKADDTASPDDFKVETSELGKETVEGHDCVKNKVTVTDKENIKHESTVWNATDLKNFPVKIETTEQGQKATMVFKNVSFDKPAASQFEPPTGLTKYTNIQTMMQTEMMKKMGGAAGH